MILDSCFPIDLLVGDAAAVAKLDEISDQRVVVPTLVYTDIAAGIDPDTSEGRRFDGVMDGVSIVPYDAEAARHAVGIQRGLHEVGNPIGAVDGIIAGTALARDDAIVTRNTGEFARRPASISPY